MNATVRSLGTFTGGSYGYGNPAGVVELWLIDCDEARQSNRAGVGSLAPWVYPTEAEAKHAIETRSVLIEGHGTGRRLLAGPSSHYQVRATKLRDYPYRHDVRILTEAEAKRIRLL